MSLRLPRLKRIEVWGSSSGHWAVADHDGIFLTRDDEGAWTVRIASMDYAQVRHHGVCDVSYATRSDALRALTVALTESGVPVRAPFMPVQLQLFGPRAVRSDGSAPRR